MKQEAERVATPASRVIFSSTREACREAEKILESARSEARTIIENAWEESNRIHANACEEGLAEGRSRAIREVLSANRYRRMSEQAAEKEIIGLCMDTVALFLDDYRSRHEDWIVHRVKTGLKQLQDQRVVAIRMNPGDLKENEKMLKEITQTGTLEGVVRIVPDSDVGTGDCIFESPAGTLDASITQSIHVIRLVLLECETDNHLKGDNHA